MKTVNNACMCSATRHDTAGFRKTLQRLKQFVERHHQMWRFSALPVIIFDSGSPCSRLTLLIIVLLISTY